MTRKEAVRINAQEHSLCTLGFTPAEAESLRRISMTLHRWSEHECNGVIERNEDDGNRPYWSSPNTGRHYVCRVPDREAGALKRLQTIVDNRNHRALMALAAAGMPIETAQELNGRSAITSYVQGDPRGGTLYILRPGDVPEGEDASGFYNRGICVY